MDHVFNPFIFNIYICFKVNILSPIAAISETFVYEGGRGERSLSQHSMRKSKGGTPEAIKSNLVRLMTASTTRSPVNNLHLSFFKPSESDISDVSADVQPIKVFNNFFLNRVIILISVARILRQQFLQLPEKTFTKE